MIEGVDYSYSPPSPSGLAAAGKKFAVRYGAVGNTGKYLTAAEVKALKAAGIDIVANVEESAHSFQGTATGVRHAKAGDAFFRNLGMPAHRPIYFSVDWRTTADDWPAVDAALRGAATVIGANRVGVYGGYNTIAHCASAGTAAWFWQTYAWSGGRWHPAAHLQQYKNGVSLAGGTVDLTRAMTTDYGQWGASVAVSQNGWPVDFSGDLQDESDLVPGVGVPGIRKGDVSVVLRYVARRFHAEVEPLHDGWCWGWFVRPIIGSTSGYSNHSSGTAVDFNAPNHPLGSRGTFSTAKAAAIRRILTDLDGVVRWGGDYTIRADEMHFEIIKGAAAVKVQADKIRGTQEEDVALTPEDKAYIASFFTLGKQSDGTPTSPVGAAALSQGIPNSLAGGKRTTVYTVLADIGSALTATGKKVDASATTLSAADQKIDAVTAALSQIGTGGVDEQALAEAIVNALPTEAADRFVDALIERVRHGTGPT